MKLNAKDIEAVLWLLRELISIFLKIKKEKKNEKDV